MTATVVVVRSSGKAVIYYERDGYYLKNDPEHRQASFWYGDAAKALGLRAHVHPSRFLLIHEAQQGCRDATYEPSRFPVAVPYPSPHRATPAYVVVTSSDLDTSRNKASVSGLSWISRSRFESVLSGYVPGTDLRLGRMREGQHEC